MPQTPTRKGFRRPSATDRATDGFDAIADLADDVDAYLDSGWITAGFVMQAGFTNTGCRYRKYGGLVLVELVCTRSGAQLNSPSTGNMSNTNMVTLPAGARHGEGSQMPFHWVSDETNGGGMLTSSGVAALVSMNSTSSIATGSVVSATLIVPRD